LKKVFITGATGYIGNAFVGKYSDKYCFKAFGRSKPGLPVEYCKGDILDLPALIKASSGADIIVHAAALTPDRPGISDAEYMATNLTGTHNILRAAVKNKIKKIIFLSSVCAVGIRSRSLPVKEDDVCRPSDGVYGFSKMAGERLCKDYSKKHSISVLCIRPATVVPQHKFVAPQKGNVPWIGFVDIEDVLQLLDLALAQEKLKYGIFHAAPDNRFSAFDISSAKKLLGYKPIHNFENFTKLDFAARIKFLLKKLLAGGKK
jgi:uronate dehydrogenase